MDALAMNSSSLDFQLLNDFQREALRPWRAQAIINARGIQVGERRAAFTLQTP